jgi:hypothetical protein
MIPVESLLFKFDTKLNKLATLQHQQIPLENKILAINEAIIKLIKVKINPNNTLGLGFEAFKKRYEDLQVLVEPSHDHELVPELADELLGKWTVDLTGITNYMFYVDAYALADKGNCIDRVIYIDHDLSKHADVTLLLANNQYKPSFEYQETFDTLAGDKLEIYTDGTFGYTKIFIGYLRYPASVDYPGYTHLDGTLSTKVDSELPAFLEDEILNYAIQDVAMSIGDKDNVDYSQLRIKTSE